MIRLHEVKSGLPPSLAFLVRDYPLFICTAYYPLPLSPQYKFLPEIFTDDSLLLSDGGN